MSRGFVCVGVLLIGLAVSLAGCGAGGSESGPAPTPTKAAATATPTPSASSTSSGNTGNRETVSITIYDEPSSFFPTTFNFRKGNTYRLQFNAPEEFHTFTVAALGIDIFINPREAATKDITFDQVGTFRLVCLPHEAAGMTGQIIVN